MYLNLEEKFLLVKIEVDHSVYNMFIYYTVAYLSSSFFFFCKVHDIPPIRFFIKIITSLETVVFRSLVINCFFFWKISSGRTGAPMATDIGEGVGMVLRVGWCLTIKIKV